mmetsp:Transcript_44866/g.108883  ORF Transcript_44866/g.108883 Transcript_44866/m.108883 type:complete len:175 (+) Transcript_44866:149-673(+)
MGFFGTKKDPAADQLATAASQPGAIPVATPVPAEETTYNFQQQTNPTTNTVPIKATIVTAPQPPAAVQSSQHSQQHQSDGGGLIIDDPLMIGRRPTVLSYCPNCRQVQSRTRTKTFPSWQTWTASAVLCFVFWPISWVPLVVENCQKTEHYCVSCQSKIAHVTPFSDCCVTHRT